MWLHLFFGQYVFSSCYISSEVHNPVSLWSFEPLLFSENTEEKWISTSQSLLETARTFPWEPTCFHSTLFILDFLKELSSPVGARFTKELSRWEHTWENLLVNMEQRQQEAEVSGGALRRSSFRDPTCFPAANLHGPWEILCRLLLEEESNTNLSTLSSAERAQLQSHFINYFVSKQGLHLPSGFTYCSCLVHSSW